MQKSVKALPSYSGTNTTRQLEPGKHNNINYSWSDCSQRQWEKIDKLTYPLVSKSGRSWRYGGKVCSSNASVCVFLQQNLLCMQTFQVFVCLFFYYENLQISNAVDICFEGEKRWLKSKTHSVYVLFE